MLKTTIKMFYVVGAGQPMTMQIEAPNISPMKTA